MHPEGGGMATGSDKQKLNTRSSTDAKLVTSDDFLTKILWLKIFSNTRASPWQRILYSMTIKVQLYWRRRVRLQPENGLGQSIYDILPSRTPLTRENLILNIARLMRCLGTS